MCKECSCQSIFALGLFKPQNAFTSLSSHTPVWTRISSLCHARDKWKFHNNKLLSFVSRRGHLLYEYYINVTGRLVEDRIKKYNRDIRQTRTQTSAVSEHAHNTGHQMLWKEVVLIVVFIGTPAGSKRQFTKDFPLTTSTERVKEKFQKRGCPRSIKKHNNRRPVRRRPPREHLTNSEDRNAPIIIVENQPITVKHPAL